MCSRSADKFLLVAVSPDFSKVCWVMLVWVTSPSLRKVTEALNASMGVMHMKRLEKDL